MSHDLLRQLQWHGLSPWWTAAAHAVVVLFAAALIVALHRHERRLVSRPVGGGLLLLRLLVLGLILLTLWQPVLTWSIQESKTGRIVIGIDQSQSMQVADRQASRAEKLRWARGLGMIGNAELQDQLDGWQQAFDRGEEPEWASVHDVPDEQERLRVSAVRRENLLGMFSELNELTRAEMARRLLTGTSEPVLDQLQRFAKVELFVFAGQLETVLEADLEQVLAEPSAGVHVEATDLAAALKSGPVQASSTPVLGVVLLTDGRQTAKGSPLSAATSLGQLQVPIYPVLLGTQHRPKDYAIPALDAPTTVFRGDEPLIKATLQASGFEGVPIDLELQRLEGDSSATVEKRTITPTAPLTTLEFQLPPAEVGRQAYVLKVPVQDGETHENNNTRAFGITVVDDRAKVLVVDNEPRWEFRYLETALSRDERIALKSVVFQQPYLRLLPDTYFPRTLPPGQPSPFAETDVVILGDVAPWQMTDEHWSSLEKFVSEDGGTLVLSSGKNYLPAAYRSPLLDRLSPMTALKPVHVANAAAQVPPVRRGMRLHLTPEAELLAMFHFSEDGVENRDIWARLPGPVWAWIGTAKPAATVWTAALLPDQAKLMDERQQALIAHHHYGFGQVVWLGWDSTWRWRHRVGDKYHHQFWAQLVRWAVSNKISAGNEFVRFGPERAEVTSGEDVLLRTRWSPDFLQKFPQLSARAEILRLDDEEPFATVDLPSRPDQPMQREGKAVNLPAGDYRTRLVVQDADLGANTVEATFSVRPPTAPELIDTTSNPELLKQLAQASGGRLLFADEMHRLPELLRPAEMTEDIYHESPLWDRSPVLLLFFALLMVEWVLRKWNGLP